MVQSTLTGMTLDPAANEPLYRQLFDQIVARIRTGAYSPGHRLPPTRDLARELATNRNTVVHAYAELEAAGFVTSTVGRGTFVASSPAASSAPARPSASARPVNAAGMPWPSLVSRVADAEPLGRYDRLAFRGPSKDAINLTRMQPSADLLPDGLFRRCVDHVLRTQGAKALGYAPREGLPALRAQIVADLARQGVPAAADDLIITTGSQQGLYALARMLINPGDAFLVEDSTYAGAINVLTAAGARLISVPSDDEGPELAALERLTHSGAKGLYLMPGCNNPTTRQISAKRRERLLDWSHRAGVPLIEDDYAADLHLDGDPPPATLRAMDGDVLYIGTYSKKLIPALRIGFVLIPPALRPRLLALKHAMDLGTSLLAQHALAELLERGYLKAHLARVLPEYRRRRDALSSALARYASPLRFTLPRSGLILWLPLPAAIAPEALFDEAQRQGVLVSPSTLHSASGSGSAQGGIRLPFCPEPPDRLAEGAKRLGRALAAIAERYKLNPETGAPQLGAV
ncbi:MAG: PLP-dependent aminotransferase family protein [Polyangiaceae bacterium]|nr:PLP-dependent aminotransferase family protein [Polyangiaceae bacterium]